MSTFLFLVSLGLPFMRLNEIFMKCTDVVIHHYIYDLYRSDFATPYSRGDIDYIDIEIIYYIEVISLWREPAFFLCTRIASTCRE